MRNFFGSIVIVSFAAVAQHAAAQSSESAAEPGALAFDRHVDLGQGQLILKFTDVFVPLDGGEHYSIQRMYSSKPPPAGGVDAGPSLAGVRWAMSFVQMVVVNPDQLTVINEHAQHLSFAKVRPGVFDCIALGNDHMRILEDVISIDWNTGQGPQRWAVYNRTGDGRETLYYRTPTDAELANGVEPLPHGSMLGLILQQRFHNRKQQTYQWTTIHQLQGEEAIPHPRPIAIYLNPKPDTITNWEARIDMQWHDALAQPKPSSGSIGKLASIVVRQRNGDPQGLQTQRQFFTYRTSSAQGERDAYADSTGGHGDLLQIRLERLAPNTGQWETFITQYRYHHNALNETDGDTDNDDFIEHGNNHQLKAILLPQQIQEASDAWNLENENALSLIEFAERCLTLNDGDDAARGVRVMDLAREIVPEYEIIWQAPNGLYEGGRVKTIDTRDEQTSMRDNIPYRKAEYAYLNYISGRHPNPPIARSCVERLYLLDAESPRPAYLPRRTTYLDLHRIPQMINGKMYDYYDVAHHVVDQHQANGKISRLATKHRDSRGQALPRPVKSKALDCYTPGKQDNPETLDVDETVIPVLRIQ